MKSTCDHLKNAIKNTCKEARLNTLTKELEFTEGLKLPSAQKTLLPKAVEYLDRGGLTFFKRPLWAWMESVEANIVEHLNFRCYRLHGDQLFSIAHTALMAEKSLIGKFIEGATASTTITAVTPETFESVHPFSIGI